MATLRERIDEGRCAIALAKSQGQDVPEWEAHLKKLEALFSDYERLRHSLGVLKYNLLRETMESLESVLPADFYHLLEQNEKANNTYLELEERVGRACWNKDVGVEEFQALLEEVREFHVGALRGGGVNLCGCMQVDRCA